MVVEHHACCCCGRRRLSVVFFKHEARDRAMMRFETINSADAELRFAIMLFRNSEVHIAIMSVIDVSTDHGEPKN